MPKKRFKIFYNVYPSFFGGLKLAVTCSSDKANKLLKEWLYSDFSDLNRNPSAQDLALKCQFFFSFSKTG